MSNIWFSSDLHFGHENVIKYCSRPFANADEMNKVLIKNWNDKIKSDDVVYILGDVFFCGHQKATEIMHALNGKKRLVYGNHDKIIRNQIPLQKLFDKILPELNQEYINGILINMCHYPLLSWNKAFHGSWMLHGHVHSPIAISDPHYRRYDVGVDAHNYSPVSFREIQKIMDKIDPRDSRERGT